MNNLSISSVWFWQLIISPHMADLAVALARRGCKVTYVAQHAMSDDRARQGWSPPALPGVTLQMADSNETVRRLVQLASADSIHICQGVRANGPVGLAQIALGARGLRQWVVMETVNDSGWRGVLKRMEYSRIFRARSKSLHGVLATGHRTTDWVVARGMPAERVYPFAYFLPDQIEPAAQVQRTPGPFRFVFAGRLIPLKRVDWLVNALAGLMTQPFELWIVGAGPEEPALRTLAAGKLGNRVRWLGQLSLPDVPAVMAQADCLVLPSIHDGWGAVASEALMVGTPVICSDACGVAGVINASNVGGVFGVHDIGALARLLSNQLTQGIIADQARAQLAAWATCLGAAAGAAYLQQVLTFEFANTGDRPVAPWLKELRICTN
jgi:glycosyltransferase involved in cell wall biosynthesis